VEYCLQPRYIFSIIPLSAMHQHNEVCGVARLRRRCGCDKCSRLMLSVWVWLRSWSETVFLLHSRSGGNDVASSSEPSWWRVFKCCSMLCSSCRWTLTTWDTIQTNSNWTTPWWTSSSTTRTSLFFSSSSAVSISRTSSKLDSTTSTTRFAWLSRLS